MGALFVHPSPRSPQVSFKPQVFVQELVFNVFGLLSLPLMVALVSWRGVFHRCVAAASVPASRPGSSPPPVELEGVVLPSLPHARWCFS